jgi:glyoxylase-like metal-dependent hydrolase (beta-lactamase superfamily II)/rhodanese-related sulfurtransferase
MGEIVALVDEGLGNSSYLVELPDGAALVVDPVRDPAIYSAEAEKRGWRIRAAAETHLHADFVSGGRELQARGATLIAAKGAELRFGDRRVEDGDEVYLGGLTLRALATPGHTPEHMAYLLAEGTRPIALFSGGTLIVGGVARPDLLGPSYTERLARAAYRSIVERILPLPDDLPIYPTHGAGSFCSAAAGGERTTTVGRERRENPLLQAGDDDQFVERLLGGLGSYPPYFLRLRDVNREGPRIYGSRPPRLPRLSVDALDTAVNAGAELVDVRPFAAFGSAHVPGALSIELRAQFGVWLGWLVASDRPLVFVLDGDQDREDLVRQCLGIGYEHLAGELDGGIDSWQAAGRPVRSIPVAGVDERTEAGRIIDVRQRAEWNAGHVPDARHLELGSIAHAATSLPPGPLQTHCAHGQRSMTAASLLLRAGHDVRVWDFGPDEWAEATGRPLAVDA